MEFLEYPVLVRALCLNIMFAFLALYGIHPISLKVTEL